VVCEGQKIVGDCEAGVKEEGMYSRRVILKGVQVPQAT